MVLSVVPDWLVNTGLYIVAAAPFVAIFVIYFWVKNARARKRATGLTDTARELGFTFEGAQSANLQGLSRSTALFHRGRPLGFKNVMTGQSRGLDIRIFDYTLQVKDVDGRYRNVVQTVVAFMKADCALPGFELSPAGVMQKLGDVIARNNIAFESFPDFSRRYQLHSLDEAGTRELFGPALLAEVSGIDPKNNWRIEGAGDTLIVYRTGKRVDPVQMRSFLDDTAALAPAFFRRAARNGAT